MLGNDSFGIKTWSALFEKGGFTGLIFVKFPVIHSLGSELGWAGSAFGGFRRQVNASDVCRYWI